MQYSSYRDILEEELSNRRLTNPAYSVRAFARDLGIPSPRLTNILNKKQGLSVESAKEIAKRLKITDGKKRWFYLSAGALHSRSEKGRKDFQKRITELKNESKVFSEISLEYFTVISEWYHFGIRELTFLSHFKNDLQWISETLGITTEEAQTAIDRMKRLGLLTEEDGKLIASEFHLATPDEIPSSSIRKFNSQLIQKALLAIETQRVEEREIASVLFPISKAQLPELKNRLKDFRREFSYAASSAKDKDSLYCLSMQFYALSKENE